MSQAGKFIPGGGGGAGKKSATRTGPIRAPSPAGAPEDPNAPKKKLLGAGSGLRKPVQKNQKLPIVIMSASVFCLLVSAACYTAYLRMQANVAEMRAQVDAANAAVLKVQADAADAVKKHIAEMAKARGTLTVDSNPSGAKVTIGDFSKKTPANFTDIVPGSIAMVIQADGYEDFHQDVTIDADKPLDLGTIQLVQKSGNLSISSAQSDVTYTITGPAGYTHDGKLPDKLEKLPIGDYVITATQKDWTLSPVTVTIKDHDNAQKEIKFPYANVSLTSVPPGATVRQGNKVLGQTPLSLNQIHPGEMHVSVDLPPYTIQRFDLHVPDFGNVIKQVTLKQDKDFVAACGMPMVWIADGGFWGGKYEVRQSDFETVTGYDPSTFNKPSKPVETVSWESAQAFIDKLNEFERKAGKLPQGYHYSLPKESQWDVMNADAALDQAATSRVNTLTATQDSGFSAPNKYGLYDTLGNVWELCLDNFDDKGNHSIRGGCWLSSPENFQGPETRQGVAPKYADKFIGMRVVLVHD
jgi:formylglycine-generating enzyme required for sulfatase activity